LASAPGKSALHIALGAPRGYIFSMIIRHAAWPSGIGILIGESAALGIETILSNYLYGVTAEDPLTYASVSAFLASVGLGASYLPSRRAAAIDPLEALRIE